MKISGRKVGVAALLAALMGANACGDDPFQVIEELTFAPSLGVELSSMTRIESQAYGTAMYVQDLEVGTGAVAETGQTLDVTYTGWLANGTQFDTGSFSFQLGLGGVLPGFDLGMIGIQVGGTRLMVIPPELGYADRPRGIIPAGSVLVFRVTLDAVS